MHRATPWSNLVDFYHFSCLLVIVFLSTLKLGMLYEERLFVTVGGLTNLFTTGLIFDGLETVIHSPRYLCLFTISLLYNTKFIGKPASPYAS